MGLGEKVGVSARQIARHEILYKSVVQLWICMVFPRDRCDITQR